MRQLISEAIDAHLKLLRFEELLLTGFIHIAKSHQQTRVDAAWLPLSRLHSCGYCRSVCETEPQDYPNQRLTQEAACYIIQRHLLRVIAQIVQDKMLHSERSLRNGKESVPSLALGCPKH